MTKKRLNELLITKQEEMLIELLNIKPLIPYCKDLYALLNSNGDGSVLFKRIDKDNYALYDTELFELYDTELLRP
jgi:hypothetical protein